MDQKSTKLFKNNVADQKKKKAKSRKQTSSMYLVILKQG